MSRCIPPPNVTVFICSFPFVYFSVLKHETYTPCSRTGRRMQPSQHSHYKTAMSARKRSLSYYSRLCLLLLGHGSGTDFTFFFFYPPTETCSRNCFLFLRATFFLVLITCFGIFQTQASIFFKNI